MLFLIASAEVVNFKTIFDIQIKRDTKWTIAGSPYIVAIQINVFPNVTLIIASGALLISTKYLPWEAFYSALKK